MITPPTARPRSERQRRPKNHQVAVAYTVWAVLAVGIAVFGWVAAELFRANTEATSKPERQAFEAKVSGVKPGAEDDAEDDAQVNRYRDAILERDRQQREARIRKLDEERQKAADEKRKKREDEDARKLRELQRELERRIERERRREPEPEPKSPTPEDASAKAADEKRQREAEAAKRKADEEAARKRAVVQDLFEKAVVYRAERDPENLLDVLVKLKALRPAGPQMAYGLGEVYSSFGKQFHLKNACSEFQRFLDLTTVGKPGVVSSHRLQPFTQFNIQQVRMMAQQHLARLNKKHKLLLVTSRREIAKLVAGLEKELKDRNKFVRKCKASIAALERGIISSAIKRRIRNYRKAIASQEGKIKFVRVELARIRDATR